MRELLFIGWLWFGLSIILGNESTEQETDNQTENVELVQELEIGHGLAAENISADLEIGLLDSVVESSEYVEGEVYTANFTEEERKIEEELNNKRLLVLLTEGVFGYGNPLLEDKLNLGNPSFFSINFADEIDEAEKAVYEIYGVTGFGKQVVINRYIKDLPNLDREERGLFIVDFGTNIKEYISEETALYYIMMSRLEANIFYFLIFMIVLLLLDPLYNYFYKKEQTEVEEDPYENYYSLSYFIRYDFLEEDCYLANYQAEEFISKHKAKLLTNGAIEHNNELMINPSDTEAITSYIQDYFDSLLFVQVYLVSKYQMTPIAAEEFVELNEHELLQNGAIEVLGLIVVKNKKKLNQFMKPEIKGMIKTSRVVTI